MTHSRRTLGTLVAVLVTGATILSSSSLTSASLSGSGQLTDVASVNTDTGSVASSALTTTPGVPAASSTGFSIDNSNSNVDTFARWTWATTPYYGTTSSQTSVTIRGTTYQIADLVYFKQETVSGTGTVTTLDTFAPLLLKNSATIGDATFSTAGNACTAWTGTAATGFLAASAGTLTFKYHTASSPTSAASTSQTFDYCLDTTNDQVYLGTATAFGSDTLAVVYSTASALATLKTYQYAFVPTGQSTGAKYCLTGYTGSGTSATPDLAMCQYLPYSSSGATKANLYPLFDPPADMPSGNQAGASNFLTFSISGTQWDPYQPSVAGTTNSI
ncbi:MAG: hypothetical protein ACYDDF_08720 [Thermoplasmatota archaeon]